MENEYREREENPMDAVRGKSSREKYSTEMPREKAAKKESVKKASAKP